MPRPHEDLEKHTTVDHRTGGPPIAFEVGSWCAISGAHVSAGRVYAELSAYETLIERARSTAAKAKAVAIFRSTNDRRVTAIVELAGHTAFEHLRSAWDDHHLRASHHDKAESLDLGLYRATATAGIFTIDPSIADAHAFEHVARQPRRVAELIAPIAEARGFRGARIFGSDDGQRSVILYSFVHREDVMTFRTSEAGLDILGPESGNGDSLYSASLVKTFA